MEAAQKKTNLEKLLFENNMSFEDYGKALGITGRAANNKVKKITQFTLEEIRKTCSLFPNVEMAFIFETYGEKTKSGA